MDNKIESYLANVSIIQRGEPRPIYFAHSRYFASVKAGKFAILVENHSNRRLEAVVSVDGLNVLKDEPASIQSPGMIVRSSYLFEGFLVDNNTVRSFVFGDESGGVAERATGSKDNIGVIGVALYQEMQRSYFPPRAPSHYSNSSIPYGLEPGAVYRGFSGDVPKSADLSVHMGETLERKHSTTHFERATIHPVWICEIHYRSHEMLLQMGVVKLDFPSAFPGSPKTGYERY